MSYAAAASGAGSVLQGGAAIYGAISAAKNARDANRIAAENVALNRANSTQNNLVDALNNYQNAIQRDIDNGRYDQAVAREQQQRNFINNLATATQMDANGNAVVYDRVTNSWVPVSQGIGRTNQQRSQQQTSAAYTQALLGSTLGNMRTQDRLREQGAAQGQQRALGQALLARYAQNQGRTPEQMEAAGIERNVAQATDPLRTGGNMAMLSGYRQGNSGNDALLAALARQSQGGTRSAIAEARYGAPTAAYGEQDARSKSVLSPATALMERGSTAPGDASPVFGGDTSGALIAAVQRGNAAGVGSQLNPRSGSQMGVGRASTNLQGYTPLNASGNQWAGVSEALGSIVNNKGVQGLANRLGTWWNGGQSFDVDTTSKVNPSLMDALTKSTNTGGYDPSITIGRSY